MEEFEVIEALVNNTRLSHKGRYPKAAFALANAIQFVEPTTGNCGVKFHKDMVEVYDQS